jgi:methylmalonyl-CoA epimerase
MATSWESLAGAKYTLRLDNREIRRFHFMTLKDIDHIAVAVHSMAEALATFSRLYGIEPERTEEVASDKITEAMLPVGDTYLQLLEPTDPESTVAKFLEKRGPGLHHIAIRVDDLEATLAHLKSEGAELIDETPRIGGGGHRVAFVHPKTTHGILIELIEQDR